LLKCDHIEPFLFPLSCLSNLFDLFGNYKSAIA
jgi:hypothetical protein